MGQKKRVQSARKNKKESEVEKLQNDPSLIHQQLIPVLRSSFEDCMARPEYWWIMDESLAQIGASLQERNYVVIDGFLGRTDCEALRNEVKRVHAEGHMRRGALAGGRTGKSTTYVMDSVRGDHIGWFGGDEEHLNWKHLPQFLTKADTLMAELRDGGHAGSTLDKVDIRSNAMCTCYPGQGTRYIRHCDNPNNNGRVLTMVYYMNLEWKEGDGGEIRVYSCMKGNTDGFTDCDGYSLNKWDSTFQGSKSGEELKGTEFMQGMAHVGTTSSKTLAKDQAPVKVEDVQPLADRLILFYSDRRVPHEVLAAHTNRYAVTTWFMSQEEVNIARARPNLEDESRAAMEEIANLKRKYGGDATLNGASSFLPPHLKDDHPETNSTGTRTDTSTANTAIDRNLPSEVDQVVRGSTTESANPEMYDQFANSVSRSPNTHEEVMERIKYLQTKHVDESPDIIGDRHSMMDEVQSNAISNMGIQESDPVLHVRGADISKVEMTDKQQENANMSPTLKIPEYHLRKVPFTGKSSLDNGKMQCEAFELAVLLPSISGIEDVILDIEPRRIFLEAGDCYSLSLELDTEVDVESSSAKFKKKERSLKLTLPLVT